MRLLTPAAHHLRDARHALRSRNPLDAARHFVRAVDRLPPRAPGRDVALWGLVEACRLRRDFPSAVGACRVLQQSGLHAFYRAKAGALAAVFATAGAGGGDREIDELVDPVERYALHHMGADGSGEWHRAAWAAFLWSVDAPPAGLDAAPAWGSGLVLLADVAGGRRPPELPTLHFTHLWRALAQPDGLDWLGAYAAGMDGDAPPGDEADSGED